jgi:hypothetical protein
MAASLAARRPLLYRAEQLTPDVRRRLVEQASRCGKAVVVGAVFDTIKRVEDGVVRETIDRDKLRWPVAWACKPGLEPPSDPPPAEWFSGAAVIP